jgi:hypothetical protein
MPIADFMDSTVIQTVRTLFKAPELVVDRPFRTSAELSSPRFAVEYPGIEKTLEEQLLHERATAASLAKEVRFVRRMLDDRDQQFADLQRKCAGAQRRGRWRFAGSLRTDFGRLRRSIRSAVGI